MESLILDKVRKLLSKTTESNCTQAEADGAMAAASRLLAQHNLTMADIARSTGSQDEVFIEEFTFRTGRWTAVHNLAYGIVHEFCYVQGMFQLSRGNKRKVKELYLFGLRENVETAKFMFSSLLSSFDHLWDSYRARTCAPLEHKYSFTKGVAEGFSDKMRSEQNKFSLEQDTNRNTAVGTTAIVLASVAEKTLKKYKERHPDLKNSNIKYGVSDYSSDARQAGYRAGQNLNLRRGIEK